jgi:ABC-type cobalamin/Fe3+-siderophores transport system ATPase subunit
VAERITHVTLRCFRGVPDELSIPLESGKSLVVLGDNGTGKSSITDGVSFFRRPDRGTGP